jgi:hypothetical protein
MSSWLIVLTGVIYLYVGGELIWLNFGLSQGKVGLGLAYIAYAFANVGLYMSAVAKN